MNQIGYDKWQAMIRLPYLTVLAFWIGQRARLYPKQVESMLAELAAIQKRDLEGLLGQIASDAAAELVNHLKTFNAEEISHFPLQCSRVLTAARAEMTTHQFHQYLRDHEAIMEAMHHALPWHGRLRAAFQKSLPQDPRVTLRSALEKAVLATTN